jgi:hypothetical protein
LVESIIYAAIRGKGDGSSVNVIIQVYPPNAPDVRETTVEPSESFDNTVDIRDALAVTGTDKD